MDPWHLFSDLDNIRIVYELQTISLPNMVTPYLARNQMSKPVPLYILALRPKARRIIWLYIYTLALYMCMNKS